MVSEAKLKRNLKIRKLCLNICVGESGDRLTPTVKVLKQPSGQTPIFSRACYTICSFFIRRTEKICRAKAEEILECQLKVCKYELSHERFSENGKFGFGIQEHIDLGIK